MRPRRKEWKLLVPQPLDRVWDFFSRPENLNAITPDTVDFEILTPLAGQEMYEGMMIQYRIAPLLGIKMNWITEITHIQPKRYFVDDQRVGPYALWHHEHHFAETEAGTIMHDILHYQVPFGPLGSLANALLVEGKVDEIFRYRERVVGEKFGAEAVPTHRINA